MVRPVLLLWGKCLLKVRYKGKLVFFFFFLFFFVIFGPSPCPLTQAKLWSGVLLRRNINWASICDNDFGCSLVMMPSACTTFQEHAQDLAETCSFWNGLLLKRHQFCPKCYSIKKSCNWWSDIILIRSLKLETRAVQPLGNWASIRWSEFGALPDFQISNVTPDNHRAQSVNGCFNPRWSLPLWCSPSTQWLLVSMRHLCLLCVSQKDPSLLFFQARKNHPPFAMLLIFTQQLRDPVPLGQGYLPYPPRCLQQGTCSFANGFLHSAFHTSWAPALQHFVVGKTTGVPRFQCLNPRGIWPFFASWEPFISLSVSALFAQWR